MKKLLCCLLLAVCMMPGIVCAKAVPSEESAYRAAKKAAVAGPSEVTLGDQAKLKIPQGYLFIPPMEAADVLRSMGNSSDERLLGLVISNNDDDMWFVTVEYNKSGYIKDDDAKNWNVDELLASYKEGTVEENKARKKQGFPELEILGWIEKPQYDASKKQLVWSMSARHKGEKESNPVINYNTYVLGREGYIEMCLVTGLKNIDKEKPIAIDLLSGTQFVAGKKYEDYNAITDKAAEYGLAALIGGAAVKKLGIMAVIAKFAKVIIGGVVVAGAGLFSVFRRKKKKAEETDIPQ